MKAAQDPLANDVAMRCRRPWHPCLQLNRAMRSTWLWSRRSASRLCTSEGAQEFYLTAVRGRLNRLSCFAKRGLLAIWPTASWNSYVHSVVCATELGVQAYQATQNEEEILIMALVTRKPILESAAQVRAALPRLLSGHMNYQRLLRRASVAFVPVLWLVLAP